MSEPAALQTNWPTGTSYGLFAEAGAGNYRYLGVCPLGGTVIDNGSVTTIVRFPIRNGNSSMIAGQYQVSAGGDVAFWSANGDDGSLDVHLGRVGVNTVGLGKTQGATDATLSLGGLQLTASTAPTCDASHAGTFNYLAGTGGADNSVRVCVKISGTYGWKTVTLQ